MKRATLLVYAKPPRIGLAKTRLAKSLASPVHARRIAAMMMARTIRAGLSPQWRTVLYTTPYKALKGSLGGLWPGRLERRLQCCGDLTARLNKGLWEAGPGPVLFIGADAPDISQALICRALVALRRNDAVFGPSNDGGFWLFGLNRRARAVNPFRAVRWSSPHAMADVLRNCQGMRVAHLPVLRDIDDACDWYEWCRQSAANRHTIGTQSDFRVP